MLCLTWQGWSGGTALYYLKIRITTGIQYIAIGRLLWDEKDYIAVPISPYSYVYISDPHFTCLNVLSVEVTIM